MKQDCIEIGGMVRIPKSAVPHPAEFAAILDKELTFTFTKGEFSGSKITKESIQIWNLSDGHYHVPRFFDWQSRLPGLKVRDVRTSGASSPMHFIGNLIQEPGRDQPAAVQALVQNECGILACSPGKGKTIMALAAMAQIPSRCLIVVPTEFLLDQWISKICGDPGKGIKPFTNLTRSEVGVVQGDRCDYERPVVVAMLQSLAQHDYPEDLYDTCGIVVVDEVHRIGAATWLSVVSRFKAIRRWGLSATVDRKDGMHKAFKYHMGPVIYEMLDLGIIPEAVIIDTGVDLPKREYTNVWNDEVNISKLYTALAEHKGRNELLTRHLRKAAESGRKVLALSRRLSQLDYFQQALGSMAGIVKGATKPMHRDHIFQTKQIILATEQVAGLGLDQPDLDTLFWLTPSQNVDQNVGRLLRLEGAKKKLVIDPVDKVPILRSMSKAREKRFRELGYEVRKLI